MEAALVTHNLNLTCSVVEFVNLTIHGNIE